MVSRDTKRQSQTATAGSWSILNVFGLGGWLKAGKQTTSALAESTPTRIPDSKPKLYLFSGTLTRKSSARADQKDQSSKVVSLDGGPEQNDPEQNSDAAGDVQNEETLEAEAAPNANVTPVESSVNDIDVSKEITSSTNIPVTTSSPTESLISVPQSLPTRQQPLDQPRKQPWRLWKDTPSTVPSSSTTSTTRSSSWIQRTLFAILPTFRGRIQSSSHGGELLQSGDEGEVPSQSVPMSEIGKETEKGKEPEGKRGEGNLVEGADDSEILGDIPLQEITPPQPRSHPAADFNATTPTSPRMQRDSVVTIASILNKPSPSSQPQSSDNIDAPDQADLDQRRFSFSYPPRRFSMDTFRLGNLWHGGTSSSSNAYGGTSPGVVRWSFHGSLTRQPRQAKYTSTCTSSNSTSPSRLDALKEDRDFGFTMTSLSGDVRPSSPTASETSSTPRPSTPSPSRLSWTSLRTLRPTSPTSPTDSASLTSSTPSTLTMNPKRFLRKLFGLKSRAEAIRELEAMWALGDPRLQYLSGMSSNASSSSVNTVGGASGYGGGSGLASRRDSVESVDERRIQLSAGVAGAGSLSPTRSASSFQSNSYIPPHYPSLGTSPPRSLYIGHGYNSIWVGGQSRYGNPAGSMGLGTVLDADAGVGVDGVRETGMRLGLQIGAAEGKKMGGSDAPVLLSASLLDVADDMGSRVSRSTLTGITSPPSREVSLSSRCDDDTSGSGVEFEAHDSKVDETNPGDQWHPLSSLGAHLPNPTPRPPASRPLVNVPTPQITLNTAATATTPPTPTSPPGSATALSPSTLRSLYWDLVHTDLPLNALAKKYMDGV
ncbi:hypothetical protein HK102_002212 [Quaeritorhiza haematococci]|nr:hypothetical protein HK102_002212 [Quaeritorhiza haematococci]